MKCAVVLADGVKQVMFTPENENEKLALSMIGVEDEITVERKQGSFYQSYEQDKHQGYNVSLCKGGYLRAFKDTDSLMLVLKDKPTKEPHQAANPGEIIQHGVDMATGPDECVIVSLSGESGEILVVMQVTDPKAIPSEALAELAARIRRSL